MRQRRSHAEEDVALAHRDDRAGQGGGPPGRRLAESARNRLDDGRWVEEPLEVGAGEDEHQAEGVAFRLIMRLITASSTSSPR